MMKSLLLVVGLIILTVFCLSSSIVLNRYFHILVNSMTI